MLGKDSVTNWQQLQEAITVLEQKRSVLGNTVVDLTVAALKERLQQQPDGLDTAVVAPTTDGQRKQVTILFARVVRQEADTETLPGTDSLEISNALWRHLDETITGQGGTIDKHVGNAVMGLFGAPTVHEDDPERAIRAALAMRATLSNFVRDMSSDTSALGDREIDTESAAATIQSLKLKIGINSGPVIVGEVGTGDEYTVMGDAVNVASRLERSATAGTILISHETYLLVRGIFQVEALGPIDIRGKSEPLPVYMVLGVKPRVFYPTGRGVEGVETRMIGRDQELYQLQVALRTAVQERRGSVVTVLGDAGVGKSRLIHEYNLWLKSLPHEVPVFKGRSDPRLSQMPYGLLRDLFTTAFDILDTDSAVVVERKMMQAVMAVMPAAETAVRTQVRLIAQLLGLGLLDDTAVTAKDDHPSSQLIQRSYQAVADYFEILADDAPAVLAFLEDLHWADESSLDLIYYLTQVCARAPFIIVGVSRPHASQTLTRLQQSAPEANGKLAHIRLPLAPLTEDESRKLVQEILRKVNSVPPSLSDMIVSRAEGNPYFVEELIKVLIEDGIIIIGENEWRIQRSQLTRLRVPLTLNGVLQARLDRLSALERITLQRAAVIGRVFWDSAISHMNQMANEPLHASESLSALHALEKRELIFPRQNSIISGTQAYIFKHAMLREVAYESVLLRHRPDYHKQVADWLSAQSGERVSEYAGIIAEHYELANENLRATELYETAAVRAEETYNPDVAIDYYGRALMLLSDKSHEVEWQLRLQERLGQLLQQRSRLVEAAQTYMTMRYTAELDGNLAMQAHAWNGLARVQQEQADYPAVLASATQAEQVAWLVSAESELAHSLLFKAQAHFNMGQLEPATDMSAQVLKIGEKNENLRQQAEALGMLCQIDIVAGRLSAADERLAALIALQSAEPAENAMGAVVLAHNKKIVGTLYNQLGQYDKAALHLLEALRLQRALKSQQAEGRVLNLLGETARLRGNTRAAIPLYEQALSVADTVGDLQGALYYRTNLGVALTELGQYETAVSELETVVTRVSDISRVVRWLGLLRVQAYLALAFIGLNRLEEAERMALQAYRLSQMRNNDLLSGLAWRVLAQLASAQPSGRQLVRLPERSVSAQDCFIKSWQHVKDMHGSESAPTREKALTLQAWAWHERVNGSEATAAKLQSQAEQIASRLKITLPALPHPAE